MSRKLDVSVVICTHAEARWKFLVDSVRSVQTQRGSPSEIIVVIDHNPDLLKRVHRYIPGVIVVENKEMSGAAGSKNSGVAAAKSGIVAFIDDDAVAAPDWLESLINGFVNQEIVGVGGMTEPIWLVEKPAWFPEEFLWVIGCTHRGMPETVSPVRNLIACNMAVRRQVFDEIGGFRNGIGPRGNLALGCEETEFCIRVSQRWPKQKWVHQPQAKVFHHVPVSRTSLGYFLRRCYGEGQSKALVTSFVGSRDGLSSERKHLFYIIPKGLFRDIRDAVFRQSPWSFVRACAAIIGATVTLIGYISGFILSRLVSTYEDSPEIITVNDP